MTPHHDLVISRLVRAPRATVWRAWTDPALLVQWWCPRPWTTELRGFELKPGGSFHAHLSGPDGGVSDNPGCFLEIVPERRIVFTTGLVAGWRPAHEPWLAITAVIELADEGSHTRYTATCLHADAATRDRHAAMGFEEGWGTCLAQLDALVQTL